MPCERIPPTRCAGVDSYVSNGETARATQTIGDVLLNIESFINDRLVGWWTILCAFLLVGYTLVFWFDAGAITLSSIRAALVSIVSLWCLGVALAQLLLRGVPAGWSAPVRATVTCLAVCCFSLLWYAVIGGAFGWLRTSDGVAGVVQQFSGPAFRWQMLQGILAGSAIIFLVDATRARNALARLQSLDNKSDLGRQTRNLLLRDGDELVNVAIDEITRVEAAGNDIVIHARSRTINLRKPLRELQRELPETFVRIHRGMLVNLDKVERVEPAGGGRLSVHLSDGTSPVASRTGATALKDHAVR